MALLPIIAVILLAILLLFFILKDFGMANKKQKLLSLAALILIGTSIGYYSYQKSQLDQEAYRLQISFSSGEDILCNNEIVNAKNFNLITGTLTLVGKDNSPSRSLVFSLQDCKRIPSQQSKETQNQEIQEQLEKE